jgi:hypothetical protein
MRLSYALAAGLALSPCGHLLRAPGKSPNSDAIVAPHGADMVHAYPERLGIRAFRTHDQRWGFIMLRPLPPFRVRPLKKVSIRKSPVASTAAEGSDEVTVSIKALRRPVKTVRHIPDSRLKVLGRGAFSPA